MNINIKDISHRVDKKEKQVIILKGVPKKYIHKGIFYYMLQNEIVKINREA